MKRSIVLSVCLGLLCFASGAQGQEAKGDKKAGTAATSLQTSANSASQETKYVAVHDYDPKRNAEQDIKDAVAEAKRTNKRVLLEIGGVWCIWCRFMDEFFVKNPDLLAFREKNYVMLKVNFSDENKNEAALASYPKVAGYPHLFVLDANGKLLHSQDTGELEEGKGYNLEKFSAFLKQWASER